MKSSGVNGDSRVQNAASGRARGSSRSPKARLPTWSWFGRAFPRRRAHAPAPRLGPAPVVDERAPEGVRQVAHAAEVAVVALLLAGEQHVERVVEVVRPLRVLAEAALVRRAQRARVVAVRLGDHERRGPLGVDPVRELHEQVARAVVDDGVHGVQAKAVEVVLAHQRGGALQGPLADSLAVRVGVVDRLAPAGLVLVGEVGAERLHGANAGRADVIQHDVEDDPHATAVCGIHQPPEALRAAV
jgi:hypothetical protein